MYKTVYLIRARKLDPSCVKRDAKLTLASDLLEQINISCYTEYKALGPSLIYNINTNSTLKYEIAKLLWTLNFEFFSVYQLFGKAELYKVDRYKAFSWRNKCLTKVVHLKSNQKDLIPLITGWTFTCKRKVSHPCEPRWRDAWGCRTW